MLYHWINLIEFYVEGVEIINEVDLQEDQLHPAILLALGKKSLRNVVDVLCLYEDDHEQIGLLTISLKKLLLGAEVNIAVLINMCLIAEIVVLHIIKLIEYSIIEHIGEHVLLADKHFISHLQQLTLAINPSLAVVSQPNPLVLYELVAKRTNLHVAGVEEDD